MKTYQFKIEEFEKDDDTNSHVDFIAACSNLRAINYHINQVSSFEIKGIAGKIIPALSTTTSVISGLVALEYFKYIHYKESKQDKIKVENFNNYYMSMGIQYYGNSDPIECKNKRVGKLEYNMWTQFKSSATTLEEFIKEFELNEVIVSCINLNNKMIYSDFTKVNFDKNQKLDRGIILDVLFHQSDKDDEDKSEDEVIQFEII